MSARRGSGPTTGPGAKPPPGPIGGELVHVLRGLAHRLQIPFLVAHHSRVWILGLFAFVNGVLSIGLMAAAAVATGAPFIFPSLGPTAFLLFYTPTQPAASPPATFLWCFSASRSADRRSPRASRGPTSRRRRCRSA